MTEKLLCCRWSWSLALRRNIVRWRLQAPLSSMIDRPYMHDTFALLLRCVRSSGPDHVFEHKNTSAEWMTFSLPTENERCPVQFHLLLNKIPGKPLSAGGKLSCLYWNIRWKFVWHGERFDCKQRSVYSEFLANFFIPLPCTLFFSCSCDLLLSTKASQGIRRPLRTMKATHHVLKKPR